LNIRKLFLLLLLLSLLCLPLAACGSAPAAAEPTPEPTPEIDYAAMLPSLTDEYIANHCSPDADSIFLSRFGYETADTVMSENGADITLTLRGVDSEALTALAAEKMQASLVQAVEDAQSSIEVYYADFSVRPEVLGRLFDAALEEIDLDSLITEKSVTLHAAFVENGADITDDSSVNAVIRELSGSNEDSLDKIIQAAGSRLEYVRKHYTAPTGTYVGNVANPNLFGETDDPHEIVLLLEDPVARQLLEGRELSWNPDIEFLPDSHIYYYLDETILAIVWQENTAGAVGTYAEIIIADGSQIGRKLVDDTYGNESKTYATKLAAQTNSVIAISGDLYMQPGRYNGIIVYEGEVHRCETSTSDTMYVDYNGKLYFTRRNEIASKEEAQAFVDENNISFSVAFGPLMIYDYENVTPEFYKWGEIYDRYARCAFGEIDDNHYLALTINCMRPNNWVLVQLFAAKDAMMEHGCRTAYALDGGQTASIILNGVLINPVQFGEERYVSDIIYFTTAMPSYEE